MHLGRPQPVRLALGGGIGGAYVCDDALAYTGSAIKPAGQFTSNSFRAHSSLDGDGPLIFSFGASTALRTASELPPPLGLDKRDIFPWSKDTVKVVMELYGLFTVRRSSDTPLRHISVLVALGSGSRLTASRIKEIDTGPGVLLRLR